LSSDVGAKNKKEIVRDVGAKNEKEFVRVHLSIILPSDVGAKKLEKKLCAMLARKIKKKFTCLSTCHQMLVRRMMVVVGRVCI